MLDSALRVSKKYYPQILLECKYEIKKTKMENLINDYLDLSSADVNLIMKLIIKLILDLTVNNLLSIKTVF